MASPHSSLQALIELRKAEREEEQRRYTMQMAERVDEALGARVVAAMEPAGSGGWESGTPTSVRRFLHGQGEYHLVVHAVFGSPRVEVELRHVDLRFLPLAKKAMLQDVGEDWFLGALETLATQVSERLVNPRNFV